MPYATLFLDAVCFDVDESKCGRQDVEQEGVERVLLLPLARSFLEQRLKVRDSSSHGYGGGAFAPFLDHFPSLPSPYGQSVTERGVGVVGGGGLRSEV